MGRGGGQWIKGALYVYFFSERNFFCDKIEAKLANYPSHLEDAGFVVCTKTKRIYMDLNREGEREQTNNF